MTTVVSYIDKEKKEIIMGCDTHVVYSDMTQYKLPTKIFTIPEHNMIIGYAGSLALIQKVQHNITIEESYEEGDDVVDYIYRTVSEALKLLINEDFKDGDAFSLLLGFKGRLFEIDERGCIIESLDDFYSIGSGRKVALGSLYATTYLEKELRTPLTYEDKINIALNAASTIMIDTGLPFIIEKISYEDK